MESKQTWSNTAEGESIGFLPGRNTIGPLILCLLTPTFIICLCHIIVHADGSIFLFWNDLQSHGGFLQGIYQIWPTWKCAFVWRMVAIFMITQFLIIKLVPGKPYRGPVTPAGNVPIYTANGFQAFSLTLLLFNLGVFLGLYNGGILYDHIGDILSSMNVLALVLCVFLYFKGLYFPSSTDQGTTGNRIFDFYWGTELHPQIFGVHLKQYVNSRCGMMFWALFVISCAYKQFETHGHLSYGTLTSTALQVIYMGKFFWWESGYFTSMDVAHDRTGFYLTWGCLVFLPCVHTLQSMYLATHPDSMSPVIASILFVIGVASIWITYAADQQKQDFRRDQGRSKIWGQDANFIEAKYQTQKGETKTSLLLASGWWGIGRQFRFVPEFIANLTWTLPIYTCPTLLYFYLFYITVLLIDRSVRDDARCHSKYGKYWEEYCKRVPYRVIPGLL